MRLFWGNSLMGNLANTCAIRRCGEGTRVGTPWLVKRCNLFTSGIHPWRMTLILTVVFSTLPKSNSWAVTDSERLQEVVDHYRQLAKGFSRNTFRVEGDLRSFTYKEDGDANGRLIPISHSADVFLVAGTDDSCVFYDQAWSEKELAYLPYVLHYDGKRQTRFYDKTWRKYNRVQIHCDRPMSRPLVWGCEMVWFLTSRKVGRAPDDQIEYMSLIELIDNARIESVNWITGPDGRVLSIRFGGLTGRSVQLEFSGSGVPRLLKRAVRLRSRAPGIGSCVYESVISCRYGLEAETLPNAWKSLRSYRLEQESDSETSIDSQIVVENIQFQNLGDSPIAEFVPVISPSAIVRDHCTGQASTRATGYRWTHLLILLGCMGVFLACLLHLRRSTNVSVS